MNVLSQKLVFVLLASTVIFAGCKKKPVRPVPGDTTSMDGGLNATDVNVAGDLAPGTDLAARDGVWEDGDKIYGLLGAPVYFEFDKSGIAPGERPKLQAAQAYLAAHPEQRILLEGRCDWRGTPEYNLGLGDRRAASARQYLETLGVTPERIETVSKGDLEATENAAEDVMAKDRRVELIVLKK